MVKIITIRLSILIMSEKGNETLNLRRLKMESGALNLRRREYISKSAKLSFVMWLEKLNLIKT